MSAGDPVPPTAAPTSGPIGPTDANYPKYSIEFSGVSIDPIPVSGPHTFSLVVPPGGRIKVELSRISTDAALGPNLKILFSEP